MGPMIVATMFEELKVFEVVDRIVQQFQHGVLPIGPGEAGRMLYRYWREAPNRMSEQERRNFAAITLGVPGGDPSGLVNRDFNVLWIRFVSSVSSFIRQNEVDALLRSAMPSPISHQQVRKAARDLASNLSLHGYGMAHYAAREVQAQVNFMIKLLQDPEIRGCYGARDMWQVVDQVATYDLGGAKTSSRYRTLADLRHDHHSVARQQGRSDQPGDLPVDQHRRGSQPTGSVQPQGDQGAERLRPVQTPASSGWQTPLRRTAKSKSWSRSRETRRP